MFELTTGFIVIIMLCAFVLNIVNFISILVLWKIIKLLDDEREKYTSEVTEWKEE